MLQKSKEDLIMKRIGILALAVILITGCNAMKPNMEET